MPDNKSTKEMINELARMINNKFPKLGFVLLLFEFHNVGFANYISNANRKDIIKALREAADRLENKQDKEVKEF